jgi:hypothetical protein
MAATAQDLAITQIVHAEELVGDNMVIVIVGTVLKRHATAFAFSLTPGEGFQPNLGWELTTH